MGTPSCANVMENISTSHEHCRKSSAAPVATSCPHVRCSRHVAKASKTYQCRGAQCSSAVEGEAPCFGTLSELKRHSRDVHGMDLNGNMLPQWRCPWEDCNRFASVFRRHKNLDNHLKTRHGGRRPTGHSAEVAASAKSVEVDGLPEGHETDLREQTLGQEGDASSPKPLWSSKLQSGNADMDTTINHTYTITPSMAAQDLAMMAQARHPNPRSCFEHDTIWTALREDEHRLEVEHQVAAQELEKLDSEYKQAMQTYSRIREKRGMLHTQLKSREDYLLLENVHAGSELGNRQTDQIG